MGEIMNAAPTYEIPDLTRGIPDYDSNGRIAGYFPNKNAIYAVPASFHPRGFPDAWVIRRPSPSGVAHVLKDRVARALEKVREGLRVLVGNPA
jgi:hypothetical protein